jgi:hypothetical protein
VSRSTGTSPPTWAALACVAGGIVNVALWPIFTHLHGPTSFNRDDELLGLDALFWGALMEGPSSLLVAAGLAGAYAPLTSPGGRIARWGLALAMIALVLPAIVTIAIRAPVPPLLAPVLGVGLILLAIASRRAQTSSSAASLLLALGAVQLFALVWTLAVRPDLIDRIDGYRIYGIAASVLWGIGWVAFGISLLAESRNATDETSPLRHRP